MGWETVCAAAVAFMNSAAGTALAASGAGWLLARLYLKKPLWQAYEGTIIAAVKYAEKAIPDGTANTSAARLDAALKYVLNVYETMKGGAATTTEMHELSEGIQIVHQNLESAGTLAAGTSGEA